MRGVASAVMEVSASPAPSPVPTPAAPAAAAGSGAASAAAPPQQPVFCQLESVRIRDYWVDEARDFTPWLAREKNLGLLGEAIDRSLELVGIGAAGRAV